MCTLVASLLVLAPATTAATQPQDAPTIMPLEEVRPGATGYGLSVFRGQQPERFEVEVLGVWRNVRPGVSYIVARLSGQGLEQSGVIAGMSGSPIYLDDRLAGAVVLSWPFSQEAIAGIIPIESMHQLIEVPQQVPAAVAAGAPADLKRIASGDLPESLLTDQLSLLRPDLQGQAGYGVQWTAVGFGERSRRFLAQSLGSLAPAGSTDLDLAVELQPGASVAGVLVDGDLRLAVIGTVTDRIGDEIVAFGHPFLGLGPVRLPMATTEVVTVLASRFSSFKIANLGRVVGAFDLDRLVGIRGRLGLEAPTTRLKIRVRGARNRVFDLRVADLPSVAPGLIAISVLGSLEAATRAAGSQGLDLEARFDLGERGALEIRQSFDGDNAAVDAALYLLAVTGFILQNRMERVEIGSLEVELTQFQEPRIARLVEVHASRTLVRPGERVLLNFEFVAFRGERSRRSYELEVPTGIPDGRYSLLVGDGVSIDVARLTVERSDPLNFSQALGFLRSLHSRRDLAILGLVSGPGLAVAGEVLPRLPGSLRSIWGAAASTSAVPLRLAVADEHVIPLDVPVEGIVRVDLEVRRRGPLSTAEPGGGEGTEIQETTAEEEKTTETVEGNARGGTR
ncbi:MAG: SpoIVB peptidase S55 domain-containing protein [Thermoanaerobaculia bacterium]